MSQVSRVVVFPRNGYLNRLQAIASSQNLAQELNARFEICWTVEKAAPLQASMIFQQSFIDSYFREINRIEEELEISLETFAPYLQQSNSIITLAGDSLGEQHFMRELRERIYALTEPTTIVIRAGGNFSLSSEPSWKERSQWYATFQFNQSIEHRADSAKSDRGPYLGLHLRYTDRSHETPTRAQIKKAIVQLTEKTGIRSVFIASDAKKESYRWKEILDSLGIDNWCLETSKDSNAFPERGVEAFVDWRLLTRSEGIVYFSASSFGVEAAVASGKMAQSIALAPSDSIRLKNRAATLWSALYRYPINHGWIK